MIDAFDEIGGAQDRAEALEILSKLAHELPHGLRIVVTSRFEGDIQMALRSPEAVGVDYMLMEGICGDLTIRDISLYVHDALGDVEELEPEDLNNLAMAAGDSFQWVSTACRYIRSSDDGEGHKVLETVSLCSSLRIMALKTCNPNTGRTLRRGVPRVSRGSGSFWAKKWVPKSPYPFEVFRS